MVGDDVVGGGFQVEALLFDLGQVVINIDFDRAFARWAGFSSVDEAAIRDRFSHDDAYKKHETGAISQAAYFDSLRGSLGIDISDTEFLAGWNAIFLDEMPGIAELLNAAAKRWPVYAFSNSNRAHEACWSARYAGVLATFNAVFVSSTIGLRKPDAAAFEYVAGEIGVPAGRIIFFDDSAENVEGARSCGLNAVHVATPNCVRDALAALAA